MKIKIDTKEKFHAITVEEQFISANMTEDLNNSLLHFIDDSIKNVVLKMNHVKNINESAAQTLAQIQQKFYDSFCSFIICELQPEVENFLEKIDLIEILNVTITESEAWDIVQMEEIERELLNEE